MIRKIIDHKKDVGLMAAICVVVAFFFWKVIFLAEPISKVFLLGRRDVLFRKYFTAGQSGFDESVFLLLAPYYHLVAHYWRDLCLPLWNPYCGWGLPLLGDIQSASFSPFRLAFALNPSMYLYNLLLVVEIALAAVGTYLFVRHLRASRAAAVFAATAYAFCPFTLYFVELVSGTSSVLLPWVFWLFMRLGSGADRRKAVLCSVSCAVFIASGHPEASFVGISFATFSLILFLLFQKRCRSEIRWIAVVAVIAICLAAPVIFPFLEYLINSDCYKFVRPAGTNPPVLGILLPFLQPIYSGASPYVGVFCFAFAALSLFVKGRKRGYVISFLSGSLLAFICICRPLFFEQIFVATHASVIPGTYCIPIFLLLMTVTAAFGFDFFVDHLKVGRNKAFYVFSSALFVTCLLPAFLKVFKFPFQSGNFDNGVADMAFSTKIFLITCGLAILAWLLVYFKEKRKLAKLTVGVVLIAISFGSLTMVNRLSLPGTPAFQYDRIDPLPFLQEKKERVLSVGFDVLCPNTNVVYKIASIGTHNVMQPARYKEFIVAAGAKSTTFNTLVDKMPLSRLVDFSGVKYIVSLAPVRGEGDREPEYDGTKLSGPVRYSDTPEIELTEARIAYDSRKAEVLGALKFDVQEKASSRFAYLAVILDEHGNPLWFGGLMPVKQNASKHGGTTFAALVPLTLKAGQKFFVGLQVFDNKKMKFLQPNIDRLSDARVFGSVYPLREFQFSEPDKAGGDLHYRLVSESGPQRVRVYENRKTLGRAYMVFSSISARTPEESLKLVSAKDFDGFSKVVIEGGEEQTGSLPGVSVPLTIDQPDHLEMTVKCPQPGFLVLTDTYFPGWNAEVDGKPAEILRANYLFRAVRVEPGEHRVVFSYRPMSFTIAVLLFLCGVLVSVFLWISKKSSPGQVQSDLELS